MSPLWLVAVTTSLLETQSGVLIGCGAFRTRMEDATIAIIIFLCYNIIVMQYTEQIRNKVNDVSTKFYLLLAGCTALIAAKEIPGTRDVLPEPFDVMDHAGNINGSAQFGYAAGMVAGKYYTHWTNDSEVVPSTRSVRTKMAMGGLAVGLAVNGLIESKFGMKLVHWENTSDPIDFIYGVGAATAAASLLTDVERERIYVRADANVDTRH